MSRIIQFCFLVMVSATQLSAQIFVDIDATGNGDGSSWQNAYTDLFVALANNFDGEFWIADGTYVPTGTSQDTNSTFLVVGPAKLYGGFDGTELNFDDRDVDKNKTILSGDINGDDIDGNFDMNRSDNCRHVVSLVGPLGTPAIFDGLTIKNGNTSNPGNVDGIDLYEYAGGGIFSYATIHVRNCSFSNNYGRSGGCVAISSLFSDGNNSIVENCSFENNLSNSQSAGILLNEINGFECKNNSFTNNTTNRGCIYPLRCQAVNITECEFRDNATNSNGDFGASIFSWNSVDLNIDRCVFEENTASFAAAIYFNGSELDDLADNVEITSCTFSRNRADNPTDDGRGGALYISSASCTIDSCTFLNNSSITSGGDIHMRGDDCIVDISNSSFTNGSSGWGGSISNYAGESILSLSVSDFVNGNADTSGGAIIGGFTSRTFINDCSFLGNAARFGGGLYLQNDSTSMTISNSEFLSNSSFSGNGGGAIRQTGGSNLDIESCSFTSNTTDQFGGAISASNGELTYPAKMSLSNSKFTTNTADVQGGGVSIVNVDTDIINCEFAKNINNSTDGGAGGGLSLNSGDSTSTTFNVINSTFVDNFALVGAGLSVFEDSLSSEISVRLLNNIFQNDGANYAIESGDPEIISLGGNLSSDETMDPFLTNTNDAGMISEFNFANQLALDFNLTAGSPAINNGIAAGAPLTDLNGSDRVDEPDSGAYEFGDDVGFEEINFDQNFKVNTFPNPAQNQINISIENEWLGVVNILIYDVNGKIMQRKSLFKNTELLTDQIWINTLAQGMYKIILLHNEQGAISKFVKN